MISFVFALSGCATTVIFFVLSFDDPYGFGDYALYEFPPIAIIAASLLLSVAAIVSAVPKLIKTRGVGGRPLNAVGLSAAILNIFLWAFFLGVSAIILGTGH